MLQAPLSSRQAAPVPAATSVAWVDQVADLIVIYEDRINVADEQTGGESGRYRAPRDVQRMRPFDIGLLKGEAWPGNVGRGIVHRSPAVPTSAARRVFVSIEGV